MARSFRRMIRGRSRSVREMIWAGTQFNEASIAANSVVLLTVLNAAALAFRPFTIIRTHMLVSWATDQTSASEETLGALGKIIVSDQAAGAGVASVPDPSIDADAPWYVWQPLAFKSLAIGTPSNEFHPLTSRQYVVDSKAMRKVEGNETSVMVAANADSVHGARISVIGRFLLKLH